MLADRQKLWKAIHAMMDILNGKNVLSWEDYLKNDLHVGFTFHQWEPKTFFLYRASFITDNDPMKDRTSRYSYPPKEKCCIGRCNLPGQPVFYAAETLLGAIQEVIITSKSQTILEDNNYTLYVSLWENTPQEVYHVFDLTTPPSPDKISTELTIYLVYLSELFKSKAGIDFSSGFSSLLIYGQDSPVKVIRYPTVARDGTFRNYAFRPTVVDNDFKLLSVYKLRIPVRNWYDTVRKANFLTIDVIQAGKPQGDHLIWNSPDASDFAFLEKHGLSPPT